MQIPPELHIKLKNSVSALRTDRLSWWNVWRELAMYYMPKRYMWLTSPAERSRYVALNGTILDPTGTTAARTLAAGLMNGVTSPSRPWFKLRLAGYGDDIDLEARKWLDEVERRMLLVMAESNFYNAVAVMYIDLVIFGTGAVLIYEDHESVIRCYNNALGEYYLGQSFRQSVNTFAREFTYKVSQVVDMWGLENCSEQVQLWYKAGGANLQQDVKIFHKIEPADQYDKVLAKGFKYAECYWEEGGSNEPGKVLSIKGFYELPGLFPRWEISGNDAYGTGPGLDALGDVIQLQHETKKKGQSLDYMIRPPMVLDVQLQHRPTALLPGGQTFVQGINNVGAKPAYQITPPIGEMTLDIRDIQGRIREIFSNDLFKMISQLDTVRTATEIDARREEKLIMLGPMLERFENEALDPAINRIYGVMERAGLLPEAPKSIHAAELQIQYVSILSAAQSAVGVIPTERLLGLIGNLSSVFPAVVNIPDIEELLRDYARDIGVKAKGMRSRDEVAQLEEQQQQAASADKMVAAAPVAADAGKLLSETDVGGGANALQQILGG